jgi:hypothetical protein
MAKPSFLDTSKDEKPIDIARCMKLVQQRHGKKLSAQISEIAKLSLGAGKLHPEEYYYYGLYDDSRFTFEAKRQFAGKRAQNRIHTNSTDWTWGAVAHDKLAFYGLLAGLGFPIPRIYALYHGYRTFGAVPALNTARELAEFLRREMPYPFFSKPVTGMYSVGVASVEAFDAATDSLILPNGATVAVESYVADIAPFYRDGYLFQDRLAPHAHLKAICGDCISTARIMVRLADNGPEITHAVWKIPAGKNVADNFWRAGNMLGSVDIASGRVERVIRGVGPDQEAIEKNPDTMKPMIGITLPDWDQLTSLCLSAAKAFPGLQIQAWDIAMSRAGPVILEVNIGGDFNLPQLASGNGLLSNDYRSFLRRNK